MSSYSVNHPVPHPHPGGYIITPRMRMDGGIPDKTSGTDENGWPRIPDVPEGISPEDFKACYDSAFPVFLKEGCTHQDADRKTRAYIQQYADSIRATHQGTETRGDIRISAVPASLEKVTQEHHERLKGDLP